MATVAALQATEALKVLLGFGPGALCGLVRVDVWEAMLRRVPVPACQADACPACGRPDFRYLRGEVAKSACALCGDDTVLPVAPAPTDLVRLRERHRANASLRAGPDLVQVQLDGCRLLAFSSGRTLIHGAGSVARARALHALHVLG